jgi:hypothetical protein
LWGRVAVYEASRSLLRRDGRREMRERRERRERRGGKEKRRH